MYWLHLRLKIFIFYICILYKIVYSVWTFLGAMLHNNIDCLLSFHLHFFFQTPKLNLIKILVHSKSIFFPLYTIITRMFSLCVMISVRCLRCFLSGVWSEPWEMRPLFNWYEWRRLRDFKTLNSLLSSHVHTFLLEWIYLWIILYFFCLSMLSKILVQSLNFSTCLQTAPCCPCTNFTLMYHFSHSISVAM